MKEKIGALLFKRFAPFLLVLPILLSLAACAPKLGQIEKDMKSSGAQAEKAAVQLGRILNGISGAPSKDQQEAIKFTVENIKAVPQCKKLLIDMLTREEINAQAYKFAADNLQFSFLDDDIAAAFTSNADSAVYFRELVNKTPVPEEYLGYLSFETGTPGKHPDYSMGKIIVLREGYGKENGLFLDYLTFMMPAEHRVSMSQLGDADTVMVERFKTEKVGTYSNGTEAKRIYTIVSIYDAKSKKLVYQTTLTGESPPATISDSKKDPDGVYGARVSDDTLLKNLKVMNFKA